VINVFRVFVNLHIIIDGITSSNKAFGDEIRNVAGSLCEWWEEGENHKIKALLDDSRGLQVDLF
jgi:hypothetical protein